MLDESLAVLSLKLFVAFLASVLLVARALLVRAPPHCRFLAYREVESTARNTTVDICIHDNNG